MQSILVLARLTFREATRRRIAQTATILGLAFLVIFNIGFAILRSQRNGLPAVETLAYKEINNLLLLVGLYAVNFLVIIMAALVSADTLAGEISSGTVQTLVSKPIRRLDVVMGKWLGFAGLLGLYLLLMAGGEILSVWVQSGLFPPNVVIGVLMMYLEALIVMSITLAFSTRLSTLATGGAVIGLYGLAFIGGWVEQFGAILQSTTAVQVGIVSSLIMPVEAVWRRAAYEMTSPLVRSLGGFTPFTSASIPSVAMIVYAGLFLLAAILLAVRGFSKRDL